jgi:hypothetical protein
MRAAIKYFWPRLLPGGVCVIDDLDWHRCVGVRPAIMDELPDVPIERTAEYQGLIRKPA